MASHVAFTVTDNTLRIINIATYPFALGLGISFATNAKAYDDMPYYPSSFLPLCFVSLTGSVLFSIAMAFLSIPKAWTRAIKFPKGEDSRRKMQTYSTFGADLLIALALVASVGYTCAQIPYSAGYYYNSPRDVMVGTYATVPLMINMCVHGFFVGRAILQKIPVDYAGMEGTTHYHRGWTGSSSTRNSNGDKHVPYTLPGASHRERVYRDLEGQSVTQEVGVTANSEVDKKKVFEV
ncbi:hypothetical protein K505DRAFT_357196 [Melanomma pulvis-pyrius CBS 109.77]|uniref:Uncharacterized protein n=1 Tax=Melanomma pulvis-pyrius CBS 109.77 TaxID=1314802 RepID=A0A6A6XSV0_9PLEO|nr:hypothetical protein K505DRAFT_357196 [Melanomma pulvis-pyrius CBS 109.77]